ncbi:MAG: hypothetical protein KBG80_06500 [Breznakibacter sp.]|nr:hypothetical protein [Breznakibacter sp.]
MKILFFFLLTLGIASENEISTIRELYSKAAKSSEQAIVLSQKLSSVTTQSENLLVAYRGASFTLNAKYAKRVLDKVSLFKEGVKYIESAVKSDSANIEIRFVRFTVQENAPEIVGYKKNLQSDKRFILSNYKDQTIALKSYLKAYLKNAKTLTDAEKVKLY